MNLKQILDIYYFFLRTTAVKVRYLLVAAILIFVSSLFQMTGLGLIVPVLNALVDSSQFEGILTTPVLGDLIRFLPFELENQTIFIVMMVFIFTAVLFENIFLLLGRYAALILEQQLVAEVRIKLFEKYIRFHPSYFKNQAGSTISTLVTTLVESVKRTSSNITLLLTQAMFGITFLALMCLISLELSLFSLILLPVIHVLANRFTAKIKASAQSAQTSLLQINHQVIDTFDNLALVKQSNGEQTEINNFKISARRISEHLKQMRLKGFMVPALVDVVNAAGILLVVGASIFYFVTFSSFSLGRLLVFFISLRRFISNAQQFTSTLVQASAELPDLEALKKHLLAENTVPSLSGSLSFNKISGAGLEFKNVSFRYPASLAAQPDAKDRILEAINFTVAPGKLTALAGASGAGKTTLINLISRHHDCTGGEILLCGRSIYDYDLSAYRRKVSIVSQSQSFFNQSVGYNLTYGLQNVKEQAIWSALEQAQIAGLIHDLPESLDTLIGKGGAGFSGGELQRLSIARAILNQPEILILDEPTSALDARTEESLTAALSAVIKDRTTFVIAHRLITIKKADQILFLSDGRISERGTFEQLIANQQEFYQYCQLQNLYDKSS